MKTLSLLACALHFVAVLVTAGAELCVREDGHAGYEWSHDGCCGEGYERVCEEGSGPVVSAAPACGGCVDQLSPLPGGMHLDVTIVIPALAEAGTVEPEFRIAAEVMVAASGRAEAVPRVSLPLRC